VSDPARRARRLRRAELAIRALGEFGNSKPAAAHLGVAETTLRRRVADYCEIFGFDGPIQAVYFLDRPRKKGDFGTVGA
jgi:hypothetical protein